MCTGCVLVQGHPHNTMKHMRVLQASTTPNVGGKVGEDAQGNVCINYLFSMFHFLLPKLFLQD